MDLVQMIEDLETGIACDSETYNIARENILNYVESIKERYAEDMAKLSKELEAVRKENEKLNKWILEQPIHHKDCNIVPDDNCSCGLDELLKGGE